MPALATWAPEDGVLGAVAPLALATTQPTSLVVDLDPLGPKYPSTRSLRELVEDGPRASDVVPQRSGVALLANGGIASGDAREMVELLIHGWPIVVLRLPAVPPDDVPAPIVPVHLLLPGGLFPAQGRGVYQPVDLALHQRRHRRSGEALVMPPVSRRVVATLLAGTRPAASRWLRAWHRVWSTPW